MGAQEAVDGGGLLGDPSPKAGVAGQELPASISVGVASFPKDGESAGALLAAADRRMYALKALRAEDRRLTAIAVHELQSSAA